MDDRLIDRIFSELDTQSERLVALSKIVHTNAAVLGIVTRLTICIITFLIVTSLGTLYKYLNDPVENTKTIIPIIQTEKKVIYPSKSVTITGGK